MTTTVPELKARIGLPESIHNLGEYSVWRKMPKNKDWDEDLKQYHGKDALPCSEHKKMHMFLQKCSEYLTRNCQETKLWKHIADSRGYAVDNTLALLHSEIDKAENALDIAGTQEHLKNCVIGCIAFCYCKDEQMEYPALFSHWANTLQAMYKPHKDTGNSTGTVVNVEEKPCCIREKSEQSLSSYRVRGQ